MQDTQRIENYVFAYRTCARGKHLTSTPTQRKRTQRGNVIIERNESYLLLSPIGIITNRPFNCDRRTDGQTYMYKCIPASDARLVASH